MFCRKTQVLPLLTAITGSVALPAAAQVDFDLSTNKIYRQQEGIKANWTSQTEFEGGNLHANLSDGSAVYVGGCFDRFYWPPNSSIVCPGGSTAFVTFGSLDAASANEYPYFWITEIQPAIIVEPRLPELCRLVAAPTSELRRPLGGFVDDSFGIYYNLHTIEVREYIITRYDFLRTYNASQRGAFEAQIVPGVYHYEFPRLDNPTLRARISPVVYPMPEGTAKKNNKKSGVLFTTDNGRKVKKGHANRWNKRGFYELSYVYPNIIRWSGFSPSEVFPAVDRLYISLRYLTRPGNPKSAVTYTSPTGQTPASIFPAFDNNDDPRILLAHPFVQRFTLPPIFVSGTKGVIELQLDRDLNTSPIARDLSTRRFRLPFVVKNYYQEFRELSFGVEKNTAKVKLTNPLEDFDKDGYNNLTEWILESNPTDPDNFPRTISTYNNYDAPAPFLRKLATVSFETSYWVRYRNELDPLPWYGYSLEKQRAASPAVRYILQRSVDGGKTWRRMRQDGDWFVVNNRTHIGFAARRYTESTDFLNTPPRPIIPPGSADHQYRIKVVLNKKK